MKIFVFFLSACFSFTAGASDLLKSKSDSTINTYNKDFIYNVKKAKSVINVDGIVDEADWMAAQKADKFYRVLPIDTGYAYQQSTVLITYDEKAFYLAFIFNDTVEGKRIMESFRRDFLFNNNDNFLSFFDTFRDQTNGFTFGLSASGAKWDGVMHSGAGSNLNWDCKWESKVKHYDDKWTAEMRIPFKSIRYPSDSQIWNVNFSRLDLKTNEKSAWAPVPRQFPTSSLAYAGVMKFEEPLPKSKMMYSLIPYVFGSYANDYEAGTGAIYKKDFGFDAKIGISSSMNLDLTYNPDFAQVEVDQQVANIDRFELFYPEKRQFFLENSDLFADFGAHSATPFFSRRIGLDAPVLAGARLSGKIGNDWRIGFMNMTTEKTSDHLSRNFTVASVQKKVFARSNFGFIFVNKEYINEPSDTSMFNRVFGFDYNLACKNNFWSGKFYYHRSFQPDSPDKQYSQGASINYSSKHFQAKLYQRSVGENYNAETGYVTRTGYNHFSPEVTYLFVPNKKIVSHGIKIESDRYYDMDYHEIDHENSFSYQFEFENRSTLSLGYIDYFVELQNDFDPTHKGEHYLPAGTGYNYGGSVIKYNSTRKTMFNWQAEAAKGTFYSGDIQYVQGEIGYRFQPYVNLSMNFNYTDMDLGDPYERTQFLLVGPKVDITFTDKIFWSTFVQYNEQIENLNINSRFQWRYQPVSDIYLVYTDNYFTGNWNGRNRAIVLKMTYWLN
ncbi:DUF5916 domain-containing protein [Prolixibacteraceae bacterium Z1-6]|uniref:DUF5916 domain-containing protein n=1 Tax=Draconibacterium aestuarii TaxID=2998507 RepID=A0A9X3FHC2_9BACT|nr:DUF5916 domain-containing protein [Prolixibacteraceae bacterium Z1-6]